MDKNDKNDNENTEGYDLDDIPGDDGENTDESDDVAKILQNSETLKSNDGENNEDKTESADSIDSETITSEDAALSQFADGEVGDGEKGEISEETEESEEEKKKKKKSKFITKVSIISAACVIIIAAAVFASFQIVGYLKSSAAVINFNGRNISVDDFDVFLLYNQGAQDPKTSAQDMLTQYLVLEKAAKDRNITLTADEEAKATSDAADLQSQIASYFPNAKNISLNFLKEITSTQYLYPKLLEAVATENGYAFNDADFQTALTNYIATGKQQYLQMDFKYIVTDSSDTTAEAKKAIEDGTMAIDDAIKKYSTYYDAASGIQTIALADITFLSTDDLNNLMSLSSGQVSNVIDLGDSGSGTHSYAVFIADNVTVPTPDQIASDYKTTYESGKKSDIFQTEFTKWQADAKVKVNQKVMDGIDLNALYATPTSTTGVASDSTDTSADVTVATT